MPQPTIKARPEIFSRIRELHRIPTQDAQARLIGVNLSTLRRIERGEAPSAAFIAGCVVAFDLPFDAMFQVAS